MSAFFSVACRALRGAWAGPEDRIRPVDTVRWTGVLVVSVSLLLVLKPWTVAAESHLQRWASPAAAGAQQTTGGITRAVSTTSLGSPVGARFAGAGAIRASDGYWEVSAIGVIRVAAIGLAGLLTLVIAGAALARRKRRVITISAVVLLFSTGSVRALPAWLTHQGRVLVDGQGTTGTAGFKFALLDGQGNVLWTNDGVNPEPSAYVVLELDGGHYFAYLGRAPMASLDPAALEGKDLQLRIWFAPTESEAQAGHFERLEPDLDFGAVPQAFEAKLAREAQALEGKNAADFAQANHTHSAADLTSGALAPARLPDGGVVTAKMADGAVTSAKILDGTISGDDLSDTANITTSGTLTGGTVNAATSLQLGGVPVTASAAELNAVADGITATASELNQASHGIAPTVTAANLGVLTGAGNADSLHTHDLSVAGGWSDSGQVVALTAGTDRVGIGTSNPSSALEVVGSITATTFVGDGSGLTGIAGAGGVENQGSTTVGADTDGDDVGEIAFQTKNATKMILKNDGRVGIGTTAPSELLDVAGGAIRTNDRLISTLPTGTAPLVVASTTRVDNLNVDLLDGVDSASFFTLGENEAVTGRPAFNGGSSGVTPPFTVDSTFVVGNLNADLLDGITASGFATASHTHATLTAGTGLGGGSYNGGSAAAFSVSYGTAAGTAVQGNQTATVSAGNGLTGGISADTLGDGFSVTLTVGAGNGVTAAADSVALGPLSSDWSQTGAFDIRLSNASSELRILESAGGTFFGTLDVGNLSADATFTFNGASGTVWTSGNDGSGSGLDADLVDGLDSAFLWKLGGNSGTSPGTHFLGTSDNQALELKANGARVLRLEPTATSPNLVGGYSGNSVTAGAYGASICGGGAAFVTNLVTDSYGTVCGGRANRAGDASGTISDRQNATVGGGYTNIASGQASTIGGGEINTASGADATVGGGTGNIASGAYATVAGGRNNSAADVNATVGGGVSNEASALMSTIGGGSLNVASGIGSTVGGGTTNGASALMSTIGGGTANAASGSSSTIGGGSNNAASGSYSIVPGGLRAAAPLYGQLAHASGDFAVSGDAQSSVVVLRNSSSATLTELFLDSIDDRLTIASGRTLAFEVLLVGRSSTGKSAGYSAQGVIENQGGTTAFVGAAPTFTVLGENDSSWNVLLQADDTTDALVIKVQAGVVDTNVRWVATVRMTEVAF